MAKPSRTFTGSVGEHTTGTAGPESLKTDIGNAMAMFDPAKTLSDGSAGGLAIENFQTAEVPALKTDFDTHAALTAAVHGAVSTNTASKIIIRDASARAQVADPSAAQDIATKNYVDTQGGDVATHAALTTAHGAVSAATASKMVVRDASGRAAFADPSADQDAATKKYVADTSMPLAGGTFTGAAIAQSNTDYTTEQLRNVILSTADASGAAANGAIWVKYVA